MEYVTMTLTFGPQINRCLLYPLYVTMCMKYEVSNQPIRHLRLNFPKTSVGQKTLASERVVRPLNISNILVTLS